MEEIAKKKRNRLLLWSTLFFCTLLIYSCLHDDQALFPDGEDGAMVVGNNRELTAEVAQQWYDEHNQPVMPLTRSNGESENAGGLLVKPKWNEAQENRIGDFEAVEVTLTTNKPTLFMDNETKERFNLGKDYKTVHNIARLVVLKNLETQEIFDFIMIFVGKYDYLKETKTFARNTYLSREPHYTGDVLFYATQGGFLNGWRYEDGKIVATIAQGTELGFLNSAATRGMREECHTEVSWVTTYECWSDAYYDPEFGWGPSITCTPVSTPVYNESCVWVDDGVSDWDPLGPNRPGGGGGVTVVPPSPSKEFPSYNTLSAKYKTVAKLSSADIYKLIGGVVYENYNSNPTGFANSCTLRLSYALNMCGDDSMISYSSGKTGSGDADNNGTNEWYYYRVLDMTDYLNDTYGHYETVTLNEIQGKTGIIGFSDCGWDNATGHLDIWDYDKCLNKGYDSCQTVYFWNIK